jgi:hypothetical protein
MTFQIDTTENWQRIIGTGVDVHPVNIEIDGSWVQFDVADNESAIVKTRLTKNGIDYEVAQ